jgi:hypothetical protein
VFRVAGPIFSARPRPAFDATTRRAILAALYAHWRRHAFDPLGIAELEREAVPEAGATLAAELAYLAELGGVELTRAQGEPPAVTAARLTATGIDFYEQAVLGKDSFA